MTNEVKNVPEIRFPEFSGEWEENKLNNYLKTSKIKNTQKKYNKQDVLSVSGDFGIVNQIEFQGRSFAGASVAPYGIVETGDIVYTKSPLKSSPYGIIKVNKGESGIVSTLYAIYKIKKNVDANFVEDYFTNDLRLNKYLKPLVNKGAKNDMKVSDDNALIGDVIFPKYIEEQIKISKFFSKLDRQIELEEQKLAKLEEQKKGYMQKIFSQELRFKDEKGNTFEEWKNTNFNYFMSEPDNLEKGIDLRKDQLLTVKLEGNGVSKANINRALKMGSTVYYKRFAGQFIYGKQNFFNGAFGIVPKFLNNYYSSGDVPALNIDYSKIDSKYFINYISRKDYYKKKEAFSTGTGSKRIHEKTLLDFDIMLPSVEEQEKIGDFFSEIDNFIEKQSYKVELLKERKKGFLQKMFV
ncbi:TPA: restriction endonuclease subunit S [Staphylococcus aureus]|nr:restriction endonuclease subunit S [Staphylococcus aureus]